MDGNDDYDPEKDSFGGDNPDIVGSAKKIGEIVKLLTEKPIETIVSGVCWLIRALADGIQMLANLIQTVPEGTVGPITYSYDDLYKDGVRNTYTQVKKSTSSGTGKYVITINKNKDGKEFEYDDGSYAEIPVIQADLYNMAIGNINAIDINFLVPNSSHKEKSAWRTLRNFATTIIRIVIFLAAASLITSLIWNGLHLVGGSLTPESRRNYMEGLQKFATSLLMLVGTVIIMAIGIYASQMFFDKVKIEEEGKAGELPIRVNVEETGYSFSTNATGYVRYIAGIENVDLYDKRMLYTLAYFFLALINLAAIGLMLVRMVVMLVLSIMGPIIAALHVWNQEGRVKVTYRDWVNWYLSWASIQVIFAVTYRLILESTIIK